MKPYLVLKAPEELTIFYNGRSDHASNLSGQVSGIHMQSLVTSIDAHVNILRIGRFKNETFAGSDLNCQRRLKFFRPTSQVNWADFECAEKVLSFPIHLALDPKSRKASCGFQLKVPAHLPPTTALPSIEISYAIIVSALLPCGQILRSGQLLRIFRRPIEPVLLQATPVAYSHSPLALRVSFEAPDPRSRSVAATLHLRGLSGIPLHDSQDPLARDEERIRIVPQMIQWEVEEKAIILQRPANETEGLSNTRSEVMRIVKRGIHRSVATFPSQTSGSKRPEFDAEIPFKIDIPEDVDFPSPSVATELLLDAWSSEHPRCEKARFALHTEQNLRIRFQMCESLTQSGERHGKPIWYTYTTVLPLKGLPDTLQHNDGVLATCQEQYSITRVVGCTYYPGSQSLAEGTGPVTAC
jgi:hypothetical protein